MPDAFEAMHLAWRRLRDSEKALASLRQTVVNKIPVRAAAPQGSHDVYVSYSFSYV